MVFVDYNYCLILGWSTVRKNQDGSDTNVALSYLSTVLCERIASFVFRNRLEHASHRGISRV